jgi:thiamine-phosphate pyrophosphorylase
MPIGSTIIYRHFGKKDREQEARLLRQITFKRGQQFLIGADPGLAINIGADGVHFRRDFSLRLPAMWRNRYPDWLITMAGLKSQNAAYSGDIENLDALIVSSIFESQSPSAGTPIGVKALKRICAQSSVPVIALGGINTKNVSKLSGSGAAGLAAISGLGR